MGDLVLSLFPGIGLLDMAFEEEGFCVVRGPDLLWGGDVRNFHPPAGKFDGVIGGPPCQAHSQQGAVAVRRAHEIAPDLIPEFERVVLEARPEWFLMENVPRAPVPRPIGYGVCDRLVENRWYSSPQRRCRRFTFGRLYGRLEWEPAPLLVLEHEQVEPTVTASGSEWREGRAYGNHTAAKFREMCAAQGLSADFELPGFTVREKVRAIGNGVPLPMGRAVARAVREALA